MGRRSRTHRPILLLNTTARQRWLRTERHDARGIERPDRVVAPFDVIEVYRLLHAWHGEDAPHIGSQVRVIDQPPQIALEQAMVGCVETHERDEQPNVGLGHALANQKGLAIETML